jgi:CBS domain-containing membrane protein
MTVWRQAAAFAARLVGALRPAPVTADARERLRVVLGATLGIALTAWLSHPFAAANPVGWPWIVAPMGASAVLVFAVPTSPLAQPWAVVGGNTASALVGVLVVRWLGPSDLAAGLAVGAAIALMFALRCLHPPGGAAALMGVHDPRFAFDPVLLNALLLTLAGVAYNRATGRNYPHRQVAPAAAGAARDDAAADIDADLDAVLARHNQVLDISRADLKALLAETQLSGYQRKLANLRCGDIMSRRLVTVGLRTPLQQAKGLFRQHKIKALPVVDAANHVIGIVTPADFMRAAEAGATLPAQPQVVGEIMTRQVRVASLHRYLAELIPLFSSTGHHHIPIIDGDDKLVGIVTQSDVVAALSRPAS